MWIQTHWRVLLTTCAACPVMWWISTNTHTRAHTPKLPKLLIFLVYFYLDAPRVPLLCILFFTVFLNHSNAWTNTHTPTHTHWPEEKLSLPLSLVVLQYLGKLISSHIKASALDWFSEVGKHAAAAFNHSFLCFFCFFFNHYISKACLFCPPSGTFSVEEKRAGFVWRYREEGGQLSVSIFPSHLPLLPLLN